MKVKRLEIQGFKSFKDKTVIHFDHSITGIVGPNGCGKSNIVDAFFWVMGEQSYKHMRGSQSDDLIFNGSSKYAPLGLAEATLVLETQTLNTTQAPAGATAADIPMTSISKEISVTRRLYRSGEGEYLMNGAPARLKDIQELFMDTGVGTKGYSVIEQGQIGKIVNSKPDERRLLIEEAAGIAKYKSRKKESLRKMEATQANLSRLTDIIQEIEKNLSSLERQAQKARQYQKVKEELFTQETTWGRLKASDFEKKLSLLHQEKTQLDEELSTLRATLQTAENGIEVEQIHLVTHAKAAESLQLKIQELADELSQEKSALELSRRRQGDLSLQLQALETEKQELERFLIEDEEHLESIDHQSSQGEVHCEERSQELQLKNTQWVAFRSQVQQERSQLETAQRELMKKVQEISSIQAQSMSLTTKAESAREQTERLIQQKDVQDVKHAELQLELEKAQNTKKTLQESRTSLQWNKQQQEIQFKEQEQALKLLERQKQESLRLLTHIKSKLHSLEELEANHEGLTDGTKAALEWSKSAGFPTILTPLTDLLSVSKGYESAVHSWLEHQMEQILLSDPTQAIPLIHSLQTHQQGRVSLYCGLEHQVTRTPSVPFETIHEALQSCGFHVHGQLIDFVQMETTPSLKPLLHPVCVVESAQPISYFLENHSLTALQGWSIVSMEGVVLEHGTEGRSLIRGGSLENTATLSILRRKQTIEELKVQQETAENTHHQMEVTVEESISTLHTRRLELQSLQVELQALDVQTAGLDRDIHQTERAIREVKLHLERQEADLSQLARQVEQATSQHEDLEAQLLEKTIIRAELEEKIETLEKSLLEQEKQLRSEDDLLQTLRIEEAALRERMNSLRKEKESLTGIVNSRRRRLHEISRILERAVEEKTEFQTGESGLKERVEDLTFQLAHLRDELAAEKDLVEQANAQINLTLEKTKEWHKKIEKKSTEVNQRIVDTERYSAELSHLVRNLEEKYGTGCLQAPLNENSIELHEGTLAAEVERLREKIRRLGEVNVMAIEEFETLKKRLDHIIAEKSDLEKSLENLQVAIDHINKTSEERFKKAFEAIADRFERLFPIIFGGGQAKLSLIYPENSTDILDAGVDILAQPPGKKVSNITLLSGGEKALTAVSLIFAIFMVKPSPFCVLDEVDAPLDDANIGKFNALLREMSAKSQFILITHNKKTMELNNTLYGVTMEEPGVSKMVSIEMH